MDDDAVSRRSLLARWLALGGAAGAALGNRPASAFRIEEVGATAPLARLYETRCGLPEEHAEIRRRLAAASAAPAEPGLVAGPPAETCPLCGCRVTLDPPRPASPDPGP